MPGAGTETTVTAVVAAIGGSAVGSAVTALFTGREERRKRARKRLRAFDRRLRAVELAASSSRQELTGLAHDLDVIERKEP